MYMYNLFPKMFNKSILLSDFGEGCKTKKEMRSN